MPFAAARTDGSRDNPHYSASRADCKRSTDVVPSKTVNSDRCNAGKNYKKCFFVRNRCICIAYILRLHRATSLQRRMGQCSPSTRDVCSNGKAPRADTESAPTVRGTMLVIPNKSLKQKIPEQTFEDFGASSDTELFKNHRSTIRFQGHRIATCLYRTPMGSRV